MNLKPNPYQAGTFEYAEYAYIQQLFLKCNRADYISTQEEVKPSQALEVTIKEVAKPSHGVTSAMQTSQATAPMSPSVTKYPIYF